MQLIDTIRVRLILLVAVLLIPAGILTYYVVDQNRQLQIAQRSEHLVDDARQARSELQSDIRNLLQATSMLDSVPAVHQSLQPECATALAKFLDNPDYLGAVTLDDQGNSLCNGLILPGAQLAKSYADRDYFAKTMQSGKPVVGKPVFGRLTQKPALPVAVPIKTPEGVTRGMVSTALDLGRFGKRFVETRSVPGTVFLIWDRTGNLLFRYPDAEALTGKRFDQSPLVALTARGGEGIVRTAGFDNVQRLVGFAELVDYRDSGIFVGVSVPAAQLFAPVDLMVHHALVGMALFLAASISLTWLIGRTLIWQPIQRLTEAATQLAAGNYSARVGMQHSHSEIGLLARVFDQMALAAQLHRVQLQDVNATLEHKVRERTERLQASEAEFRGVLESAADGIVIVDKHGIMVVVNTALERLFG